MPAIAFAVDRAVVADDNRAVVLVLWIGRHREVVLMLSPGQ